MPATSLDHRIDHSLDQLRYPRLFSGRSVTPHSPVSCPPLQMRWHRSVHLCAPWVCSHGMRAAGSIIGFFATFLQPSAWVEEAWGESSLLCSVPFCCPGLGFLIHCFKPGHLVLELSSCSLESPVYLTDQSTVFFCWSAGPSNCRSAF